MFNYDIAAVLLLVDFINGKTIYNNALSYSSMADLIQLADIFEMPSLCNNLEKVNFIKKNFLVLNVD